MIDAGNATVYVSDMDKAIDFYTNKLGCTLQFRAGNHWAEVKAGRNLVIGLHPQTPHSPKPGTPGAVQIGLNVVEPLDKVMRTLEKRGVRFDGPMIEDEKSGNRFAMCRDLDGNPMYRWESTAARNC